MDDEADKIEEKDIKNSKIIEIDALLEVSGAICKVQTNKTVGTGFFMKLEKSNKPFYCLITCEHVIQEEMIDSKNIIEVYYENQKSKLKFPLNKNERFIRSYRYSNIDATVVEILPEDNINEKFFLLPNLDYINGYEQFEGQDIYIPQFPGQRNLSFSSGKIKSVNIYTNEFSHLSSTDKGSSGSPIFLAGSLLVLGIHKQSNKNKNKEENYANFLGRVFDSLKNTVSSLENEVLNIDLMSNRVYGKIINNEVGRYYIGEIKYINNNPELNGPGVLYSKDRKKIYEGNFVQNKYEGKGTVYNKDYHLKGDFINGECHGKGILFSRDNIIIYEGDFAFGKFEGYGKKYDKDGNYYIGQFMNNQKHGKGTEYSKDNKIIYEGEFGFDKYEGKGKLMLDDGIYFVSEFNDGLFHGKGIIYNADHSIRYEGNFIKGAKDGFGRFNNEDGTYYIGNFSNNLYNGKGIEYYSNNNIKYEGDFVLGKYEGKGRLNYEDGDYYIGQFISGLKHGKGIWYNSDSTVFYDGDFAFGKLEGRGVLYRKNGEIYDGEFKENKIHGKGKLFYEKDKIKYEGDFIDNNFEGIGDYYEKDGTFYSGQFKGGLKFGNGIEFNKDGKLIYEGNYINGKPDKCSIF